MGDIFALMQLTLKTVMNFIFLNSNLNCTYTQLSKCGHCGVQCIDTRTVNPEIHNELLAVLAIVLFLWRRKLAYQREIVKNAEKGKTLVSFPSF